MAWQTRFRADTSQPVHAVQQHRNNQHFKTTRHERPNNTLLVARANITLGDSGRPPAGSVQTVDSEDGLEDDDDNDDNHVDDDEKEEDKDEDDGDGGGGDGLAMQKTG